jgi:hypothetical protein
MCLGNGGLGQHIHSLKERLIPPQLKNTLNRSRKRLVAHCRQQQLRVNQSRFKWSRRLKIRNPGNQFPARSRLARVILLTCPPVLIQG